MTMTKISTAKLAALSSIVEAAKASGEIDGTAITALVEAVRIETATTDLVAYLSTKKLPAADKARVAKLAKAQTRSATHDLEKMARPFKTAELPQMVAAIKAAKGVKMTDGEKIAYTQTAAEVAFTHEGAPSFRYAQLAGIMKRAGIAIAA